MTKIITPRDIAASRSDLFRRRKARKGGVPEAQAHLQSLIDTALKQRFAAPPTFGARLRAALAAICGRVV